MSRKRVLVVEEEEARDNCQIWNRLHFSPLSAAHRTQLSEWGKGGRIDERTAASKDDSSRLPFFFFFFLAAWRTMTLPASFFPHIWTFLLSWHSHEGKEKDEGQEDHAKKKEKRRKIVECSFGAKVAFCGCIVLILHGIRTLLMFSKVELP